MKKLITLIGIIMLSNSMFSQENETQEPSNIKTYTPSKLLSSGQWDIKWFNNFTILLIIIANRFDHSLYIDYDLV